MLGQGGTPLAVARCTASLNFNANIAFCISPKTHDDDVLAALRGVGAAA
jgi:hypothetical protein